MIETPESSFKEFGRIRGKRGDFLLPVPSWMEYQKHSLCNPLSSLMNLVKIVSHYGVLTINNNCKQIVEF